MLAEPLNHDNGHALREQLAKIEPWLVYASMQHREAAEHLADMRGIVFDPSRKTELERKVAMERDTKGAQRTADEWADIAKAISARISMGQSFLSGMKAEVERGV